MPEFKNRTSNNTQLNNNFKTNNKTLPKESHSIMYKEDIKVLDCTVRDGGLMNKWQFSDDFVRSVYNACVEAGIDYMEIGYLSSEKAFDRSVYGPWKFCRQDDLERIVGKNEPKL